MPGNHCGLLQRLHRGELSRVMLALKTVLAEGDEADTLIFDEIDTGIGGEVAVNVASHMKKLSKKSKFFVLLTLR